jgi:hypothetical protein
MNEDMIAVWLVSIISLMAFSCGVSPASRCKAVSG